MPKRPKAKDTVKRHVEAATLEEILFDDTRCLISGCGEKSDEARTFGDRSRVPLCRKHFADIRPVVQKFAAIQTPGQMAEVRALKDRIKQLEANPPAVRATRSRLVDELNELRATLNLAELVTVDDVDRE